jgi:hypothetical protein
MGRLLRTERRQVAGNIVGAPELFRSGVYEFSNVDWHTYLPDVLVESEDYHLREKSPCIDSGTQTGATANDLNGKRRPCGTRLDRPERACPSERDRRKESRTVNASRGASASSSRLLRGELRCKRM